MDAQVILVIRQTVLSRAIMLAYDFATPQFRYKCLDPRQKHAGMTASGLNTFKL
jgi:hypothetical protein